jgi:pimeloyl-ACP methyl ester carboxylesterase
MKITAAPHEPVDIALTDEGHGHPYLLLHGGAGPRSVAAFAQLLAGRAGGRVLVPTHPGFDGTARPDWLDSPAGLAELYAALLDTLDLHDVTVVGNSVGGWIAAELALRDSGRIGGIVLVDAVGIAVDVHPVADVFALTPAELSRLSYHDPAAYAIDPATLTDVDRARMAANLQVLRVYGGQSMADPTLAGRLAAVTVPALVLWGESDGVVDPDYGRAYAAAIPGARFAPLPGTGHLPQIESPDELLRRVRDFAER